MSLTLPALDNNNSLAKQKSLVIDTTDMNVHDLRKNEGVFIVPGDSFGMDRYFRIGLGHESTGFSKGLDLLSKGLTRVFPNNFT
jgi:aspartate/methionine/tyrosine aminotransferase